MTVTNHNSDVLLASDDLIRIYQGVNWDILIQEDIHPRVKTSYQEFSTISLFKSHALPYLLPLPSERALARELAERELLQILCGFTTEGTSGQVATPSRSTLAHFRIKYSKIEAFGASMLRVLIALSVSAWKAGIRLPFVTEDVAAEGFQGQMPGVFFLKCCRASVQVSTTVVQPPNQDGRDNVAWKQLRFPLPELAETRIVMKRDGTTRSRRRGITDSLGLPASVNVTADGSNIQLLMHQPEWLYVNLRVRDPLTAIGPTYLTRPYTACNILVLRGEDDRREVLLSRRLAGFGTGTYSLPGGKKQPHESVQEGAMRELKEETGIHLTAARPISIHRTHLPGRPEVKSVGVLAVDYEGNPRNQESMQNSEWEWFDLYQPPTPLFWPTQLVIDDFVNNTFPNLSWEDVEDVVTPNVLPFDPQLRLPFLLE